MQKPKTKNLKPQKVNKHPRFTEFANGSAVIQIQINLTRLNAPLLHTVEHPTQEWLTGSTDQVPDHSVLKHTQKT